MPTSITSPNNGDSLSAAGFGDKVAAVVNGFLLSTEVVPAADYTLTTSAADLGASASITATGANAYAQVTAQLAVNCTVASAGSCAVTLLVAGVAQTREIEFDSNAVYRKTFTGTWKIPLPVGTTQLRLQAIKTAAGATIAVLHLFSVLSIQVYDLP